MAMCRRVYSLEDKTLITMAYLPHKLVKIVVMCHPPFLITHSFVAFPPIGGCGMSLPFSLPVSKFRVDGY
jgi:hypothetical protein